MNLLEFNKTASEGQKAVLRSTKRFPVVTTGIQAGKTTVGAVWLCSKLYADYLAGIKGDYLMAAPTVKILQQSTLVKFQDMFPRDWGEWKEGAKIFQLRWGGRIFVRSTDSPDFLEGMTVRAAWLDEAGQMKQQVWINVQGRLAISKGPCLMTTTPYSMGWFYKDIVKKSESDPDIQLFSWPSTDNPAFPQDEFERARATLAPAVFERRYLGKFTQLEGLVYPDFNDSKTVEPFTIPAEWQRFGGMDFGHTNPTAVICVAEDPSDHIFYIFKEFYKSETVLAVTAAFIQDVGLREVAADPQSAQLIAELKQSYRVGNVRPADNNIDVGIQRITALFREGRLKIFKTCKNLIDELETYHYPSPDEEGAVKDKPVAKNNHACDALRYAFSKQRGVPVKRSVDPLDTLSQRRRFYVPGALRRSSIFNDPYTGY